MPAPGSHAARHSRQSYELLKRIGMTRVPAKLDECFRKPECWEALSVLGFGQELSPNSTGHTSHQCGVRLKRCPNVTMPTCAGSPAFASAAPPPLDGFQGVICARTQFVWLEQLAS